MSVLEIQKSLVGIKSLHKTIHNGKICHDNRNNVEEWETNKHINIACLIKFVKWESNGKNKMGKRKH